MALFDVTCKEDGTKVMDTLRGFSGVETGTVVGVEQVITSVDGVDKELIGREIDGEVS